jgi:hypothetical protein
MAKLYFEGFEKGELSKQDKTLQELGYEPAKDKIQQPATPTVVQGRDLFQTPNYAVDLLIPFIPQHVTEVWEPAAGERKIVRRLLEVSEVDVFASDIRTDDEEKVARSNFLTEGIPQVWAPFVNMKQFGIITNPPFSLKQQFYKRCREYNVPFALLIPADYSGWLIRACAEEGAEKIIPTRRIDYITPQGYSGATGHTADFHSLWLTWGFELGKTETYVELSLKDKKEYI